MSTISNTTITGGGSGSTVAQNNIQILPLNTGGTTGPSAFHIQGKDGPSLIITYDGKVISESGNSITVEEWIETVKVMRQFVIEVARDEEMSQRYPFLREAAHQWMMDEIKR